MTIFAIEGSKEAFGQPPGDWNLSNLIRLGKVKGKIDDDKGLAFIRGRKEPLRIYMRNRLVVWTLQDFIETAKGKR